MGHGASVSLSGDTALVGTGAGAEVFVRSGTTWAPQATLDSSDAGDGGATLSGQVALAGDMALVAGTRPSSDFYNPTIGVTQIFQRSGASWAADTLLSDNNQFGFFGASVAASGGTIAIGSIGFEYNGEAGSLYVFVRADGGWVPQGKLAQFAPRSPGRDFGRSVAISGDTAAVGSPGDSATFVFGRDAGIWAPRAKLSPPDAGVYSCGTSVAVSGSTVAVGCPQGTTVAGTAYLYELPSPGSSAGPASAARSGACSSAAVGASRGAGVAWLGGVALGGIAFRRRRVARRPS